MTELRTAKETLREEALRKRAFIHDRGIMSAAIVDTLLALPEWEKSKVISCYVSVRSEVRTEALLHLGIQTGKVIAVPWRDGDDLRLAELRGLTELRPASFGLYEPAPGIRAQHDRQVAPRSVHMHLVPGLAFDMSGARLGYGKGYYDRLLAASPEALRVALAFEGQIVESVPVGPDDERVDMIITETAVHRITERSTQKAPDIASRVIR